MNRKDRRAMERKMGKEESQKLVEKISLFEKLPPECLACAKSFDKTNKHMVQSWNVVVREDRDPPVRLYCPDCWDKAQAIAQEYMKKEKQR